MTMIQLARAVVEQKQCHLARPRKSQPGRYDARPFGGGGRKRGWFYLDLFTASAILVVHDALSEENRAKFATFPIMKAASVAFKLVRST